MNKNKKKQFTLFALLFMLCLMILPVHASAAGAKLNKTTASVKIGKTVKLKVSGTSSKVKWSSSDKSIAKVSSKGVVTGVSLGKATIKAKVNGKTYKCKVTVKNANASVSSLTFETSDGGKFLIGSSTAKVRFRLSATSANVVVSIMDSAETTVYKKTYTKCTKNKTYSFTWNGANANGTNVSAGTYTVQVKANKTKTSSDSLILYAQTFSGGTGSSSSPFLITSLEQLKKIPQYNGCYFKQKQNIDADYSTITSMFSEETPFTGTYDGGGYTISNLYVNANSEGVLGLFANIGESGTVRNLKFSNVNATGTRSAAILCCYNYGKISNCAFTGCNVSSQGNQYINVGIVCAQNMTGGRLVQCTTTGCSVAKAGSGHNDSYGRAGSIAGENNGSISDCTSSNVNVSNAGYVAWGPYAGGIVGYNTGNLINCTASGTVSGNGHAGICGYNSGVIRNCYFTGTADNLTVNTNKGTIS